MTAPVAQHPGVRLRALMKHHKLSGRRLAAALQIPQMRISAILACKRRVTADTALRLGRFFGTGPEYWLHLQAAHELAQEAHLRSQIEKTVPRLKNP